ncbi:hypothetical protein ACQP2U_43355 (plasmid) [Nocardia sp. CA-084685]|uniref:hypothetical protein n=1 Tax=Nocardia sp. CA-084685 TaxID=3239970 RepID=UPI003D991BC0
MTDPARAEILAHLADLIEHTSQFTSTLTHLRDCVITDPDNPAVLDRLTQVLHAGLDGLTEALQPLPRSTPVAAVVTAPGQTLHGRRARRAARTRSHGRENDEQCTCR